MLIDYTEGEKEFEILWKEFREKTLPLRVAAASAPVGTSVTLVFCSEEYFDEGCARARFRTCPARIVASGEAAQLGDGAGNVVDPEDYGPFTFGLDDGWTNDDGGPPSAFVYLGDIAPILGWYHERAAALPK